MKWSVTSASLALFAATTSCWPYDESLVQYNLNEKKSATNPADYWGEWPHHKFHPSPDNWRFPIYTIFLDRFVNGDPTNDNINGSYYEHDLRSTQMRHGGDVSGLLDTLDYLQGMGIKGIFLAGTVLMNQPWGYDGYSALDTTLLDQHYGNITTWRNAITEIHNRGMYVLFDNTISTLGDLLGFIPHMNDSAPFTVDEYPVKWKSNRRYADFDFSNEYNKTCNYPRFWNETGYPIHESTAKSLVGCYNSDFDQYGDVEAFGVFPDWQRELAKFASVQDRLREWIPSVRERLIRHSCIIIASLDIDGFRYDKAIQSTVDALGDMSAAYRDCARKHGKKNFFIPGEITGGNTFGSVYLGRGRQPDMVPDNITQAVKLTNESDSEYFIRKEGHQALDASAFHYSIYRSLTRFLGLSGNLEAGWDLPVKWTDAWNEMLTTNDLVNANTGKFDFRHMYGVSNQDVFRWPSIQYGVQRQLLGLYITTLHLPGIPMLLWGEEQAFNILDSTSENYIYGRQSMSPATAWMTHGCYKLGSSQYVDWPIESGREACKDPTQAYDHRDPSHPVRNIIKHMYQMRADYPSMNEGWWIQLLSNQTENVYYPGSRGIPTETGMWSILRGRKQDMQDLGSVHNNQSVWLVYQNVNRTVTYDFNCSDPEHALVAPFGTGTTVKNLFYPHDEHKLINTTLKLGIDNSMDHNGCLGRLEMQPFDFRAYVPKKVWKAPRPMITKFTPGHDAPMLSTVAPNAQENVDVALYFSTEMDCDSVTKSIHLNSSTESGKSPTVDSKSVSCKKVSPNKTKFVGEIPGVWAWSAKLTGVYNGVHRLTVNNASGILRGSKTDAVDHFLFRIGQKDNPMVFTSANYSANLLQQDSSGKLYIRHHAAGADLYRYSTNWGSSFSKWFSYKGGNDSIDELPWSGTAQQGWDGKHVTVEYWSKLTGSSDYVQDGDLAWESKPPRRFPHMFFNGPYNEYGFDSGIENEFKQERNGTWRYRLMTEWPARGQINVWGMNPDGQPDKTGVYGDIDGDNILDRMPPSSLTPTLLNISDAPPQPYLAWDILVNDANMEYAVHPSGDQKLQIVLYILLWVVPIVTASVVVYTFMKSFYQVKVNVVGVSEKKSIIPLALRKKFGKNNPEDEAMNPLIRFANRSGLFRSTSTVTTNNDRRRMILIATMEYDIEDWGIKIKIGGLGVMAQLMGKNLGHQDLIWVVPCIGGVEYPRDQPSESMFVTVLGNSYEVKVQYHVLRNITYVLLDAPVFRQQTKSEPYPSRMDDLNSAIYYSAWNQCIAQALKRFPVDLYHINDYHGSLAPLYLLPQTIPCCLSLHNADFQGLWPIRTQKEKGEVCSVFNLDVGIASRYIQFGDVFNLLHAGASYLRVHQQGFGAVGVSKKYGKRSYARYPIFWGLRKVGNLPNPDPSDTGEWNREQAAQGDASIDVEYERSRGELKRQAQEWAGLSQNPDADLLVFVGRWSMQKGVDLIADVMPAVLESRPKVQLICVGPIIDLYGKFAALKLERMMQLYPGRVFSKPEFTALPPYIFSGAEFALIPSRDEPFGLVAVEFGRKGALGIGARVGGLGQMPGWWYNVESTTTSHLLQQFKVAIKCALNSKSTTRAMMRARSAKQRFPVAQWVEDLQILQSTSIRVHTKEMAKSSNQSMVSSNTSTPIGMQTPPVGTWTPPGMRTPPNLHSRESSLTNSNRLSALDPQQRNTIVYSRDPSPGEQQEPRPGLAQQLSLGIRSGPGHLDEHRGRQNARIGETSNPNDNNIGIAVTDPAGHTADTEEVDDVIRNYYTNEVYSLTPEQAEEERRMGASRHIGPHSRDSSFSSTESGTLGTRGGQFAESGNPMNNASAALSVNLVIGEKKDFKLQQVDPFFTDSSGECYRDFERKLRNLKGANSESRLCIEEFLEKSEKKWFDRFRNARLGRNHSPDRMKRGPSPVNWYTEDSTSSGSGSERNKEADEFLLGDDYVPPSGLRKWMQVRIWDWPIYSLFLALGQIIAANSYQITLLTGQVGETADKLYGIATVYLISSIVWWFFFRWFKSVYVLSIPWFFYGIAFLIIGLAHFEPDYFSRGWIQNVGSGAYAAASSSGSVFFALNFGDENSAPTKQWVLRACIIQGTQQAYVIGLWYWGSVLTQQTTSGTPSSQSTITNTWKITAICTPIAVFLWIVGLLVFFGLPNKYRQTPGKVPSFYKSAFRRKIVLWNFVVVIIQNFFMSAPYGRNWRFLWSTKNAATWQIGILVVVFFGFVWAGMLFILRALSRRHSWILPVFACGLGAPRWAQIWWATSNSGLNLTWTGGYLAGALASRSLWLWLGVLDAIQGVGFGMILLQTLTRIHICFALLASQVVGSVATICARAFGPNKTGPGGISPDISLGYSVLGNAWFWIALFFQLLVCAGFLLFYRREQLTKP